MRVGRWSLVLAAMLSMGACAKLPEQIVAAPASESWSSVAQNAAEQRFSGLRQIDEANVGELGLAWYADLPTMWGQQATPIYSDGVLYVSTDFSIVRAFDATTGREIWSFDPEVYTQLPQACCTASNRGVALHDGKIFIGALDGQLIALSAATGEKLWSTQTTNRSKPYSISGAPRIAGGLVIIGNGGAEFGVRGYVSAFDPETGALVWRFYTVPGEAPDGAASDDAIRRLAQNTWSGREYLRYGGGGTVWDSMAYDAKLDLLYIGTGNGSPWNHGIRSEGKGDNLFLASIIALRPQTGEYVWHYQQNPGETWDYTATQHMILADLTIDGEPREVLMQAPKNGFFYVLDRVTGELLSAENYVPVNWASGIDMETGRPIENPDARYYRTGQPWSAKPSGYGGHNWHPMAYNPRLQLVYIPTQELPFVYRAVPTDGPKPMELNTGTDVFAGGRPPPADITESLLSEMTGALVAWDPVAQREVWRAPYDGPWNGGVLATAGGLVFQGDATGHVNAYAAESGRKLWTSDYTQTGIVAAPMTYSHDGVQYVAVMAGFTGAFAGAGGGFTNKNGDPRGPNRLLVYRLAGSVQLPSKPPVEPPLNPPPSTASAEQIEKGNQLYGRYCGRCHGAFAIAGGNATDLRHSGSLHNGFQAIVYDGAFANRGMVDFAKYLSREQVEAVRSYLVARANEDKAAGMVSGSATRTTE